MPKFFCLFVSIMIVSLSISVAQSGTLKKDTLAYSAYFKLRNSIGHTIGKIRREKYATVAFVGGSITFNPGWRELICVYLQRRFPETHFRFIAAGIPSLGSLPHAFRLQRDVLDSGKVDLMFLEAAVNDRVNRTDSLTQVRDLEGIVRHARRSNPAMDIVLMSFADPEKNSDYDHGRIPAEVANHELVAGHYGLPSINLAKEVHDKISNKEFGWDSDFKDLHPSEFGQHLYANNIEHFLEDCIRMYDRAKSEKQYRMPLPIDKNNLNNGRYIPVSKAVVRSGWQLINDWAPSDQAQTRSGFVHVPVLASTDITGTFTLAFKGNAVGIAVVSGPDAGIIRYRIDGGNWKHLDLRTEWSGGFHLPWYLLLGSALKNGSHELEIGIEARPGSNTANTCRIVHFLANGN